MGFCLRGVYRRGSGAQDGASIQGPGVIDSVLWVGAVVVAILLAAGRFARGIHKKAPESPRAPREAVAAGHAREAIETALQTETDAIKRAKTGDDPAGDLAALANRANEARQ